MYKTFSIRLDQVQLAKFESIKKKYRYKDLQDFIIEVLEQQYSNIR